ncbi:hypothetical protein VTL71DRAFT_8712 [Oculimacula yallundae]|uniref:Uncharacterized protein n=1 Tax=Oculimacula yallundae TaxID=86028 RepID=A0ABR4CYI9_9HELO
MQTWLLRYAKQYSGNFEALGATGLLFVFLDCTVHKDTNEGQHLALVHREQTTFPGNWLSIVNAQQEMNAPIKSIPCSQLKKYLNEQAFLLTVNIAVPLALRLLKRSSGDAYVLWHPLGIKAVENSLKDSG